MGPYCKFCDRRCFVERVLRDGTSLILATCPAGAAHDREKTGEDHSTALNPVTQAYAVKQLRAELAELAELAQRITAG